MNPPRATQRLREGVDQLVVPALNRACLSLGPSDFEWSCCPTVGWGLIVALGLIVAPRAALVSRISDVSSNDPRDVTILSMIFTIDSCAWIATASASFGSMELLEVATTCRNAVTAVRWDSRATGGGMADEVGRSKAELLGRV